MGRYRKRVPEYDAQQWRKDGDHPHVRGLEDHPANEWDHKCGFPGTAHGSVLLPGGYVIVCPGDWILTSDQGARSLVRQAEFESGYEPAAGDGRG